MSDKKRVLLNWFETPGRPEQLTVFTDIAHKIEFVHLFHRTPADRKEVISPFRMIYWFDYKSPWQLLDDIKPDKIITMNADDLLCISLIVAARSKGIPTFAMQHGFVPDNLEDIFMSLEREPITQKGTIKKYFNLFTFFTKSIKPFSIRRLWQYGRFMNSYFRKGPAEATKKFQYAWRKPDYYLCFSKYGGRYFQIRDMVPEGRLLELGVPMFDSFFKQPSGNNTSSSGNNTLRQYYLLIDTSFGEYKEEVSADMINRCYRELAAYCTSRNAVLKVKLHPWNYGNSEMNDTGDIQFYRKLSPEDLNKLIFEAKACFGFFSTLTIPVVCVKKLCQIVYDNICYKELIDEGITPAIDFFTFQQQDIVLDDFHVNEENLAKFMKKYLYKTDGKSAERLLSILTAE